MAACGIFLAAILFSLDALRPDQRHRVRALIRDSVLALPIVIGFALLPRTAQLVIGLAAVVGALLLVGRVMTRLDPIPMVQSFAESKERAGWRRMLLELLVVFGLPAAGFLKYGWDIVSAAIVFLPMAFYMSFAPAQMLSQAMVAIAGRRLGFRLWTVAIGPALIRFDGPRRPWKLQRHTHGFFGSFLMTSPSAAAVVSSLDAFARWRLAAFAAVAAVGGVAMTVGFASGAPSMALLCGGMTGFAVVSTMQQWHALRALPHLLSPGTAFDRFVAANLLLAQIHDGVRPRQWSPTLVQQSVSVSDGSLEDAVGNYLAYERALDGGEPQPARLHLDHAIEILSGIPSPPFDAATVAIATIYAEAACFSAWHLDDLDRARELLEKSAMRPLDPDVRERARAAILVREGNLLEARRVVKRLLDDVKWWTGSGMALTEAERLEEIAAACA